MIDYETEDQRKCRHTSWQKVEAPDETYWRCRRCRVTADKPEENKDVKILYRYEIEYQSEDSPTAIQLREYRVTRETEKTYYIEKDWSTKAVRKDAHNTYAYATKEDAKDHFIRRTNKRIQWFEFWIEECRKALDLIQDQEL